jgi:HAD superfamily hydrolase (TIGR01509 family)
MPSHQLPAAVLFDLDGTLVDSEHYWMLSERKLAAEHDAEWTDQDGIDLIGMSLFDSSAIIGRKLGSSLAPDEIIDRLTAVVIDQLKVALPWRPGARELLFSLREAGVKTGLVTMSMRRMALAVNDAIEFDAFDVVVAGDDVVRGKPHPEAYLKAAELLGVAPHHCIAFEDSVPGLASAEAAGTKAVGVPHLVQLEEREGRILWPTLEGITLQDLSQLFEQENR